MARATLIAFAALLLCSASMISTAGAAGFRRKLKATHFTVFWHDILSGPRPTAVEVVKPAGNTSSAMASFGMIRMIDNKLTERQELNSTEMGRCQGFYASTAQEMPLSFMMAMNLVFTSGKYNGSTLSILGSNPALSPFREMPVIGGTGHFRYAQGYVRLSTKWLDINTGDATVEYSAHVLHY